MDEKLFLHADSLCSFESKLWFLNINNNFLCEYDRQIKKIDSVYRIPFAEYGSYIEINLWERKLYLSPYHGQKLLVFSLLEKKFEIFPLTEGNFIIESRFIGIYEDMLYLYVINQCKIIGFNLSDYSQREYDLNEKYLHRINSNDIKLVGQYILFPVYVRNEILVFDIVTKKTKECIVKGFKGGITTIAFDERFFWITGWNSIASWDCERGSADEIFEFPDEQKLYEFEENDERKASGIPFLKSIYQDRYLWLFPYTADRIIRLNTASKEFDFIACTDRDMCKMPEVKAYDWVGVENSTKIWLLNNRQENYSIDMKTLFMEKECFTVDRALLEEVLQSDLWMEERGITLEAFLNSNLFGEIKLKKESIPAGMKIYEYLVESE